MKIEQITSKTFIHTQNTLRDSDGHGHPGPETQAKSALLTISTDCGHEGHIVTSPSDVQDTLLDRFVRPNLIGQDPMRTDAMWHKIYKWQRLSSQLLTDRVLCAVDLALWDLKG